MHDQIVPQRKKKSPKIKLRRGPLLKGSVVLWFHQMQVVAESSVCYRWWARRKKASCCCSFSPMDNPGSSAVRACPFLFLLPCFISLSLDAVPHLLSGFGKPWFAASEHGVLGCLFLATYLTEGCCCCSSAVPLRFHQMQKKKVVAQSSAIHRWTRAKTAPVG